jgi:hypothetical protein
MKSSWKPTRRLLLGTPLLLLAACASGPSFQGLSAAPPDKALLYLYRESRILGAAGAYEIFVNGKPVVEMSNGGYYVAALEPGEITLSHRPAHTGLSAIPIIAAGVAIDRAGGPEKTPVLVFTVGAGQAYFVEWLLGGRMERREQQTALSTLKSLSLLSGLKN